MTLLEIHLLQSFPVSCLNRDDLNSPKTATFGGVQRARVSSQCWKRAIRFACADLDSDKFKGRRSRQFISEITRRLAETHGQNAEALAQCFSHFLGKLDPEAQGRVKTVIYYSEDELNRFASVIERLPVESKEKLVTAISGVDMASLAKDEDASDTNESVDDGLEVKPKKTKGKKLTAESFGKLVGGIFKPALKREFKNVPLSHDAADVAIFGRMVASGPGLTLEGAAMFGHALSTHKVDNEIDFFTAVDDNPADDSGSAHMGTTEFNAATYYRYIAVNLSMLADGDHLAAMTIDERREVVDAFIRATLTAVPQARHNSMNAGVLPAYVLGTVKEKGQPIQLVNAFERPVRAGREGSILERSIAELKTWHDQSKTTWALSFAEEVSMPEVNVNVFTERLTAHVR